MEEVEHTRDTLRDRARLSLGVTGEADAEAPPLRQALRQRHLTTYPLLALGVLAVVDTTFTFAFQVLGPELSRSLGIGLGTIAAFGALQGLAGAVAPLGIAALAQRPRRALLSIVAGFIWSLTSVAAAFVVNGWGLFAVLVVNGLTTGTVAALHQPLLFDSYPPEARVRVTSLYTGANAFGNVFAPLAVAGLTAMAGVTWRGVFLAMGVTSLAGVIVTLRLRDPGFGRWDTDEVRATVARHSGVEPTDAHQLELGFFEIVRRIFLIPSIRRLLTAFTVFGVLTVPYVTFIQFFLAERWNLGPGARGLFTAWLAGCAVAGLVAFGKRGEDLFRRDPARMVQLAGTLLAVGVVLLALGGLSPWFVPMLVLFGAANAGVAILQPALGIATLSVIPARMRPHASALLGIFAFGVGGFLGLVFLSGIDRRFGIGGSMVSLLVPGLLGALLIRSTGRLVPEDLDRMIDETIEEAEIRQILHTGGHLPMLSCRGIDFSYGPLQVLFDVDFTVDDGEMVALLGVNGAGKSTLLRVVSGIGLPSRGTVRFEGADITYLDSVRRVGLGITQIPGGKATFGPLSVVENVRAFGYSLGRQRSAVDSALDVAFDAFPLLATRRNQPASTLSGGEQQMLALSKALILRPRVLCIDELSLGLAPVIVGQLLDMVRKINAKGSAVVLVEQSVNLALGLVDHAYFMEKGEIRFDGRSDDLLARDDLLRAVFLEGVAKTDR